jgi:hypothetical protein
MTGNLRKKTRAPGAGVKADDGATATERNEGTQRLSQVPLF